MPRVRWSHIFGGVEVRRGGIHGYNSKVELLPLVPTPHPPLGLSGILKSLSRASYEGKPFCGHAFRVFILVWLASDVWRLKGENRLAF